MKTAYWPNRNEQCTVQDFISEYGGKFERKKRSTGEPRARCPACLEPMKIVGEDRADQDPHFSHLNQNEGSPFCPLRNSSDYKYQFLTKVEYETEIGYRLRTSFMDNWVKHYNFVRSYLKGYIKFNEFIELVERAESEKLWHRPNLEEWQIPYIFLVWKDFPPIVDYKTRKIKRSEWFRFWIDGQVRTLDDLWIKLETTPLIIRANYSKPRNGAIPGLNQLKDIELFELENLFLINDKSLKKDPHHAFVELFRREFL